MIVLIRGAGEMASGVAARLVRAHFRVVFTEIAAPLCVRRTVSFCEAIHDGRATVEGIETVLVPGPAEVAAEWAQGRVPLLVDPGLTHLPTLAPEVLVDAILAKRNLGLHPNLAPLVIALGPGFVAGRDAHVVVETNRGHNLGRLIYQGPAEADTGQPYSIGGESHRRVLRAPGQGRIEVEARIGDQVRAGQVVARVGDVGIVAQLDGVLRGLIRPGSMVRLGMKIGDVDPRGRTEYCWTISDKARALGGAVLEAILHRFPR